MAVDAIVRVSFETDTPANQAANKALVGHAQEWIATGLFQKVGTAAYACSNAKEVDVAHALAELGKALLRYADSIDFVAISVARRHPAPRPPKETRAAKIKRVAKFI